MKVNLKQLKIKAKTEAEKANGLKGLDVIYKKYLGKKGEIAKVFSSLKTSTTSLKRELGQDANLAKKELEQLFAEKKKTLERQLIDLAISKEKIDVTRPSKKPQKGRLHPLTKATRECTGIFESMGFSVILGPEVDSEWYNFDALNVPKDHPARDMQDTFWLKQKMSENSKKNLLPRTHTTLFQVKHMEKNNPPFRIISTGRVFRNEATDAQHETQFHQLDGLMVDKNVSASNFKAIIEEFLTRFFKANVEIRLRPGYFPFTEPSFEIDARQKGGPVLSPSTPLGYARDRSLRVNSVEGDWLELMGAGMVHPNVFKAAGLNPKEWQGFAFGAGVDRLTMVRHKINDVRLLYQNDLRFLKQF